MAGRRKAPVRSRKAAARPTLLSGGNPRIPKGYGEAPVRAYLAALPGWKKPLGRRLDSLITQSVPKVTKAVKYNSPLYGTDGRTWFLSFHCFDEYIKVSFFRGAQLDPVPPEGSKQPGVRYLHLHEADAFDEAGFTSWVKQASALPGTKL